MEAFLTWILGDSVPESSGREAVSVICWALWLCGCQSDMLVFVGVRPSVQLVAVSLIAEREQANLIIQRAGFFCYNIYIYLTRAMPYRKPSTRFQINTTHNISQKFTTCV